MAHPDVFVTHAVLMQYVSEKSANEIVAKLQDAHILPKEEKN